MRVTKEQYERDLREPLLAMGYKEVVIEKWEELPILVTNLGSAPHHLSKTRESLKTEYNRYFIDHYNPQLFLAIAAMTDKESPIAGEWIVYTDSMAEMCGLTAGELYRTGKLNTNTRYMRKATLQELIEKFSNKETIKESVMKIEVIKPQKEAEWKFPCKGICKEDNLIVGFSSYRIGVVLNIGQCDGFSLYDFSKDWKMNDFEPIEEQEKQPIDWNDPNNFPIIAEEKDDIIIIHELVLPEAEDREDDEKCYFFISYLNSKTLITRSVWKTFNLLEERIEWLNSLKIFPKGSEIKITL